MSVLLLDTSTDLCIVGLIQDTTLVTSRALAHDNHLSKKLLPEIDLLLSSLQITPKELTGIALGIGPGSYTGTRVGVSVGKTLGFALNIPLRPFLSPSAFLPIEQGSFAFLIKTAPGPYFVMKGTLGSLPLSFLVEPDLLAQEIGTVDHLIYSPSCPVPQALSSYPSVSPRLNLPLLARFLPLITPVSAEDISVTYLHTPICTKS